MQGHPHLIPMESLCINTGVKDPEDLDFNCDGCHAACDDINYDELTGAFLCNACHINALCERVRSTL